VKVIGAGFGRTGTSSIKAALEVLGFGPCYHMSEMVKNPDHLKAWGAARGEPVDWREVMKGYEATMDWPWCTYYKDLMRAFPDAKVLLSVRDP
jgi:Sulfotransferase domain